MNNKVNKLFSDIDELLTRNKNIIIAIDGMACSGKTTLAKIIMKQYNCRVIHMDDFFLPLDLRTEDRFNTPGGNIHYERFIDEVLSSLNKDIKYRKFDCHIMDYNENIFLPYNKLTIVEGSYAAHPNFLNYYDYLIYMEIDSDIQLKRILERDGEIILDKFINSWLKYEQLYFDSFRIMNKAKMIIKNNKGYNNE